MSTRDVRDILGISHDQAFQPRPTKKAKTSGPRVRLSGVSRELQSLYGERQPAPIPIDNAIKYQEKRKYKPTHIITWDQARFVNQARSDGLLLKHWRKNMKPVRALARTESVGEERKQTDDVTKSVSHTEMQDVIMERNVDVDDTMEVNHPLVDNEDQGISAVETSQYRFSRYNYQIEKLEYDDKIYDTHLKSESWTRNETDYLVELYAEYYGKWPVIVDRYEYKESTEEDDASEEISLDRSIEDLKARYYEVAARLMAVKNPPAKMTAAEFDKYELMLKFDTKQEQERKRVKAALQTRTLEEKKEEEHLIAELRRIYLRQERFGTELKELRERLDHSLTDAPTDAQIYSSSQEINALFQKMLANDKTKKRLSIAQANASSPTAAVHTPTQVGIASGTQQRKGSGVGPASGHRVLTSRSEARFGVSTHDRLTSGVSFRSDRLARVRTVKSSVQTAKIAGILAELQVPELLQMPTTAVCAAMERLVQKINILLDVRKVREKEENELLIAKQQKALKEGKPLDEAYKEGSAVDPGSARKDVASSSQNTAEKRNQQDDNEEDTQMAEENVSVLNEEDAEDEGEQGGEGEDDTQVKAEPTDTREVSEAVSDAMPRTRARESKSHKRSASAISAASSVGSRAASKRLKH